MLEVEDSTAGDLLHCGISIRFNRLGKSQLSIERARRTYPVRVAGDDVACPWGARPVELGELLLKHLYAASERSDHIEQRLAVRITKHRRHP